MSQMYTYPVTLTDLPVSQNICIFFKLSRLDMITHIGTSKL